MPKITYINADGTANEVEVALGQTVMQGAVDNLVEGIDAECGGACACATCHCFIDNDWLEKVGAANDMEEEMLEGVTAAKSNSRLSCQIDVSDTLDGLVVHLPESQF